MSSGIKLYDDALIEKIRAWNKNLQVTITSPDETRRIFEVTADKRNDKPITLPLLCLRRVGGFRLLSPNKDVKSFDGFTLKANIKRSVQLNVIPVSVDYRLDIYTRYFSEVDEYTRNLIFNLTNYPKLEIVLPYEDMKVIHNAYIDLSPEVEDNSDIPERLFPGQFSRMTINFTLNDAYLWDIRNRDNFEIEANVEL